MQVLKDLLGVAISIAVKAHEGQKDRAGLPYITHPLRVMHLLKTYEEQIVAVLHDVIEDTSTTLSDLEELGFPSYILEALQAVTHLKGETYLDYVTRAKANPIAREVKKADLQDNSNIFRLPVMEDYDLRRLKKYHKAQAFLMED